MHGTKLYLLLFLLTLGAVRSDAQNTGIGTITPDSTAQLDVSSTTKGMLIPRMTAAQRAAIVNPAKGLQVYQTDASAGLCYFDGTSWIGLPSGLPLSATGWIPGAATSTFAGTGTAGSTNGPASTATFNAPTGVVIDAAGNTYVADRDNHRIRKITPGGVVSTYAGTGSIGGIDGPASSATFSAPNGITIDGAGNLYVSDWTGHKIRKITPAGVVSTVAGTGTAGSTDGPASTATFYKPAGLALDASGNIYVADQLNYKIRKITPAGIVSTLAGTGIGGSTDGPGNTATFYDPTGIVLDALGNLYVAESTNNKIRKVTPAGVVSTFAGTGSFGGTDGAANVATFNRPWGIVMDGGGNMYVTEAAGNKIRFITPAGVVSTFAGTGAVGSAEGAPNTATFNSPRGIALSATGNLYVADQLNNKIRKIPTSSISVLTNATALPPLDAAALVNLDADNLSSGTIPAGRFPAVLPAINGSALTGLNASNLTSGTIPATRFPATLPAVDGNAITNLNAANLSGTLPALDGSALNNLNASNIATGTLDSARLGYVSSGRLSGALPALDGSALINLTEADPKLGTLLDGYIPRWNGSTTMLDTTGIYSNSGNIGIGTTAPSQKLSVAGGISATRMSIGNSTPLIPLDVKDTFGIRTSASWDNLWFTVDPQNAYINASGANSGLSFRVGVNSSGAYGNGQTLTNVMTMLPSGNIGIGTTSPGTLLHVAGTGSPEISIQSTSTGGKRWTIQSNAGSASVHSSFQIIDRTAGASRIGIDSVGQVGIGTTNPTANLDVAGSFKLGATGSALTSIIKASYVVGGISMTASTTVDYSVSVSGAAPGASVIVSPSTDLPGLVSIASAMVSTTGTVKFRLVNPGASTAISGSTYTFYITVIN